MKGNEEGLIIIKVVVVQVGGIRLRIIYNRLLGVLDKQDWKILQIFVIHPVVVCIGRGISNVIKKAASIDVGGMILFVPDKDKEKKEIRENLLNYKIGMDGLVLDDNQADFIHKGLSNVLEGDNGEQRRLVDCQVFLKRVC